MPIAGYVVYNADVRCMDAAGTRAEAVGWRDGRVVAVGTRAAVEREVGGARRLDAGGATVLPGFVDAHHHAVLAALWGGLARLAPPAVTDIPSMQRALAEASSALEPGRWLVAMDWDELRLSERRAPTRSELDDAVPDRPVLAMHYSCHRAVVNSRALELAGIDRSTPDPSGGAIGRDRRGLPSGLLVERAMHGPEALSRASLLATDAQGFVERLGAHHRALVAAGITRIADAAVPLDLMEMYREAGRRGLLLVPTVVMPTSTTGYLRPPWDVLERMPRAEGEMLELGPLKLVFDGAPGCHMCLSVWQWLAAFTNLWRLVLRQRSLDPLRASLSIGPRLGRDLHVHTGIALYDRDEATAIVRAATDRGVAVASHAIGNAAIETVLDAYDAVGAKLARSGTPRIEHATFVDRRLVSRIAATGVAVVAQPHFVALPFLASAPTIGAFPMSPLRWLLDAGIAAAGSSDYPVAGFEPLDGIRSAVTRRNARGHVVDPDQCIELDEALAMYTRIAAEVTGAGDRSGVLEPGRRADVVILDRPVEVLEGVRVRATFIAGAPVYEAS